MKPILTLIAVLFLFTACDKSKPRKNEITKIELASGICFGECQQIAISVDSSLNYQYYGGKNIFHDGNKLEGYYKGKISKAFWDTLNVRMEATGYKKLATSIHDSIVDGPNIELIIYYQHKLKHIEIHSASLPDSIENALNYIRESYQYVKLKHVKDTLTFETKVQYLVPPPKPIQINKVKFPLLKK